MPNWCETNITISLGENKGKARIQLKELADKYKKANKGEDSPKFMDIFFPVPESVKINGSAWYNWCVENWGSKWDLVISDFNESKDLISISSESAWNPPLEGITEISKKFPDLKFRVEYVEPGCAFEGDAEIYNGDCSDDCRDYDLTRECKNCSFEPEDCTDGCPYGVGEDSFPDGCPCYKKNED